ncbi:MAG: DegT/DnrJ/EryC1/StrS family aminotransferase [Planctomycetales bacterium]|nr:DegT/DnrJ/EryC1/StrS family aminotransferase [Planctomycetales bacterium]
MSQPESETIPFVDLVGQCRSLREDVMSAIGDVVDSAGFILGKQVELFEEEFAEYCQARFCIGVASGTDALHLSLRALGIGPGDEVITAANSFIASAYGISHAGATPVLVDVDPDDYTLDPQWLEEAITPKTKAILPVHLYGQPARMDEIREVADRHGLKIIEDACQAHGAEYRGRRTGSLGDAGCFSFYPGKNLGAFGDGGAIVTNDADLAERLRLIRNYGQRVKNEHSMMGYNSRLDTLQAAILLVKLSRLDEWNDLRRRAAACYRQVLGPIEGIVLPIERDDARHVYHLYVVRHADRDVLIQTLGQQQIQCGVHYPNPMSLAAPYANARCVPDGLPVTSRIANEIVSLPMYPEITELSIARVGAAIAECTEPTSAVSPG